MDTAIFSKASKSTMVRRLKTKVQRLKMKLPGFMQGRMLWKCARAHYSLPRLAEILDAHDADVREPWHAITTETVSFQDRSRSHACQVCASKSPSSNVYVASESKGFSFTDV